MVTRRPGSGQSDTAVKAFIGRSPEWRDSNERGGLMIPARTTGGLDRTRRVSALGLPELHRGRARSLPLRSVPLARVLPMPVAPARGPTRFARDLAAALPDLRRVARRQVGNAAGADDLVQMTFLRALERQHQFVMGTNLLGWLCTILRNLHRDDLRRRRHETVVKAQLAEPRPPLEAGPPEAPPPWSSLGADQVRAAAATLPQEMRDAYLLYTFSGESYVAIARRL